MQTGAEALNVGAARPQGPQTNLLIFFEVADFTATQRRPKLNFSNTSIGRDLRGLT